MPISNIMVSWKRSSDSVSVQPSTSYCTMSTVWSMVSFLNVLPEPILMLNCAQAVVVVINSMAVSRICFFILFRC